MPAPSDEHCPVCGETRPLLSINAAAALASVSRKTIYRWIRAGILDYRVLPSGLIRVFQDSLLRTPDPLPLQVRDPEARPRPREREEGRGPRIPPRRKPPASSHG